MTRFYRILSIFVVLMVMSSLYVKAFDEWDDFFEWIEDNWDDFDDGDSFDGDGNETYDPYGDSDGDGFNDDGIYCPSCHDGGYEVEGCYGGECAYCGECGCDGSCNDWNNSFACPHCGDEFCGGNCQNYECEICGSSSCSGNCQDHVCEICGSSSCNGDCEDDGNTGSEEEDTPPTNNNDEGKKEIVKDDCNQEDVDNAQDATNNLENFLNAEPHPNDSWSLPVGSLMENVAKTKPYEYGYSISIGNGYYQRSEMSIGDKTSVGLTIGSTTAITVHSHPGNAYAGPSPGDLKVLLESNIGDGNENYTTSIIYASNGDVYALQITDRAAADDFWNAHGSSIVIEDGHFKAGTEMRGKYDDLFNDAKNNSFSGNAAHNAAMAHILNYYDTGMSLAKRSDDGQMKTINVTTQEKGWWIFKFIDVILTICR